jgi:hypothetical protein
VANGESSASCLPDGVDLFSSLAPDWPLLLQATGITLKVNDPAAFYPQREKQVKIILYPCHSLI